LGLANAKLTLSPLYADWKGHNIFICHSRWRQMLLFNKDYGIGGVAQYPVTANVLLRGARIEENRLISRRGDPVMGTGLWTITLLMKSPISSQAKR
jgi:hypothetical protein